MPKFKVGDKVRRTQNPAIDMSVGSEHVVKRTYNLSILVNSNNAWWDQENFEIVIPNLPDWIKIEPEKIIPAKKTFDGPLIEDSQPSRPSLKVVKSGTKTAQLNTNNSVLGFFTKKGLQEWIKALQELESYMDE